MAYVAVKPCTFAGQSFRIGEDIPDGIVHPGAANNLIKMQVIAEAGSGTTTAPAVPEKKTLEIIHLVIQAEEGNLPLEVTPEGLQAVVNVLTGKAADVEPIITEMVDSDALILLHMTDTRKSIKAAAEARAKALNTEEEGEQ